MKRNSFTRLDSGEVRYHLYGSGEVGPQRNIGAPGCVGGVEYLDYIKTPIDCNACTSPIEPELTHMDSTPQSIHLQIIRQHYPNIQHEQITSLTGGNDHFVYILDQQTIFRFPRDPDELKPSSPDFVKHFAQISPVTVPVGEYRFDPPTGSWYEISPFLKGVSFYPEIASTFTYKELMSVAQQLGQFLTTLHSFSLEEARAFHVNEMDSSLFWLYMHDVAYPYCERTLAQHISAQTHAWIRELFFPYIGEIKANPFQTRVTHADMWVFHIIIDPDHHTLSGVIDFATRIADPANDFKAFEHYGPNFVKDVYANYDMPIDSTFDMRRLFYTGHDMVFDLARAIEEVDAPKIGLADAALTSYIEAHPNPLMGSS